MVEEEQEFNESEDDETSLTAYLEQVLQELKRRETALASLEAEVAQIEFKLRELSLPRAISRGDVRGIQVASQYQKRLVAELKKKQDSRRLLLEDIARAKERQRMVERDLEEREDLDAEVE